MRTHEDIYLWFDGEKNRHRRVCPQCGSSNIAYILYGMPTPEAMKKVEEGKWVLGGCCIMGDSPKWHCKDCGNEF